MGAQEMLDSALAAAQELAPPQAEDAKFDEAPCTDPQVKRVSPQVEEVKIQEALDTAPELAQEQAMLEIVPEVVHESLQAEEAQNPTQAIAQEFALPQDALPVAQESAPPQIEELQEQLPLPKAEESVAQEMLDSALVAAQELAPPQVEGAKLDEVPVTDPQVKLESAQAEDAKVQEALDAAPELAQEQAMLQIVPGVVQELPQAKEARKPTRVIVQEFALPQDALPVAQLAPQIDESDVQEEVPLPQVEESVVQGMLDSTLGATQELAPPQVEDAKLDELPGTDPQAKSKSSHAEDAKVLEALDAAPELAQEGATLEVAAKVVQELPQAEESQDPTREIAQESALPQAKGPKVGEVPDETVDDEDDDEQWVFVEEPDEVQRSTAEQGDTNHNGVLPAAPTDA